jgi:O-acetylserine/cysteine efflux transporter
LPTPTRLALQAVFDGTPRPGSQDERRRRLAALSVAIVWGLTFIATKVGVGATSPLMLVALRFLFAAIPMVVFIAPPKAPAWAVALYGLLIGAGQFGLLFIAIHDGFPVGLASLVLQAQAFFTILLARLFLGERPRRA